LAIESTKEVGLSSPGTDRAPDEAGGPAPSQVESSASAVELAARRARARWLAALAGVVAGLVAFGVGEAIYNVIPAAPVEQNISGNRVMLPNRATNKAADTQNAALAFGALGVCLAGFMGVAGGLARRSTASALIGGLFGSVVGMALGTGLSLLLIPSLLNARDYYSDYDIVISLVMHGIIWGLLGAVAGLAFVAGISQWRLLGRAVTAGFMGGSLGAAAFELMGAIAFAAAETDEPVSATWTTRLLARLLVTLGVAVALVLVLPKSPQAAWRK
jgi:hypothetical protein